MQVLAIAITEEIEIKVIQIGKENVEVLLFADDMLWYIENPKDTPRKLLKITTETGKVAIYKMNIQKSMLKLIIRK